MSLIINAAESGFTPDPVVRLGIRRLVRQRLHEEVAVQNECYQGRIDELRESAVALATDAANEQHYEVPAAFFDLVLGPHLKYSSGCWDPGVESLADAERTMLERYAERGEFSDGQTVLDLGCGWGSFSLWAAARYPNSSFTAVSNSSSQRAFIEGQAETRGLDNLEVITADVNTLTFERQFDRIISVEMFEHVRNYELLLQRIASWLTDDGKLFVHIFCHRSVMYPFETEGDDNWMGRYFFTGGLMPASDTLLHFQRDLSIEKRWSMSGSHYARTAAAWLANLDEYSVAVDKVLTQTYGSDHHRWRQRWRMFFMACEELFGYDDGRQWLVCHYLFSKRA